MADAANFAKLVPGFDFLESLVKNSGAALPGVGQWIAPTINPDEIDKRIEELRTVQYWLEQNARMLGATIQALEVQRMTLSTLKTMNVQMDALRDSMLLKMPEPAAAPAPALAKAPAPPRPKAQPKAEPAAAAGAPASAPAPAVDPMQWWGALTKQFTELASAALKEGAAAATQGAPAEPARAAASAGKPRRKAAPRKAAPRNAG